MSLARSRRFAPFLATAAVLWGLTSSPGIVAAGPGIGDEELEKLLKLHHSEVETVRLVLLPTAVTDRRGRMVLGLEQEDFRLFENGRAQQIKFFSSESDQPISIAFVLDVSGSMRQQGKLRHAKEAVRYFVDNLRPIDQFALICFADEQVDWVTEFTRDKQRFVDRLSVQEGFGRTALNDAIAAAPRLVDESIPGRKAIVLITDGVDNASSMSLIRAVGLARRVNVPVFTIGFLSVSADSLPEGAIETNFRVLDRVAEETGGRLFAVHGLGELKEAIAFLDSEMRHQYMLGYYPDRAATEREFRSIRLEVNRRRFTARTRSGYFASP